MPNAEVNSAPGDQIRRLREERHLRPADIQRISEAVKRYKNCPDFGISHATLNDIETGHSVPNVRKMFSLAVCFRLPLDRILSIYSAPSGEVGMFAAELMAGEPPAEPVDPSFIVQFDRTFDLRQTAPLAIGTADLFGWLESMGIRPAPGSSSFAWIGIDDDSMADLIPGGSLIEVDRTQCSVEVLECSKLRDRPVYFCWTKDGYRCCWCEQNGSELVVVPHPASRAHANRYRQPREAAVVGRVIHAWISFESGAANHPPYQVLSAR